MTHKDGIAYAQQLDSEDALAHLRREFHFPEQSNGTKDLYLLGNSLGLQPVKTESYIQEELKKIGAKYSVLKEEEIIENNMKELKTIRPFLFEAREKEDDSASDQESDQ